MVKKIEKIEFASTKEEMTSTKQEVSIPLRINITKEGDKNQVFELI